MYVDIENDNLPTKKELNRRYLYNAETGELFSRKTNKRVGYENSRGYRLVSVGFRKFYEHRLVWKMVIGSVPKHLHIDHINRNKKDNRLSNLRLVTHKENAINRDYNNGWSHNTSGKTGVHKHCQNGKCKWWARITVDGVRHNLGIYDDYQEAVDKRIKAEQKYFNI